MANESTIGKKPVLKTLTEMLARRGFRYASSFVRNGVRLQEWNRWVADQFGEKCETAYIQVTSSGDACNVFVGVGDEDHKLVLAVGGIAGRDGKMVRDIPMEYAPPSPVVQDVSAARTGDAADSKGDEHEG